MPTMRQEPRPFSALWPEETRPSEWAKESAVQTNDTNGHQHDVSEKRIAPGAFPCRLDLELCACGAKRWVDQDGNVATPWQFINPVTRQKGQERATTALRTPARAPGQAGVSPVDCPACGQSICTPRTSGGQPWAERLAGEVSQHAPHSILKELRSSTPSHFPEKDAQEQSQPKVRRRNLVKPNPKVGQRNLSPQNY